MMEICIFRYKKIAMATEVAKRLINVDEYYKMAEVGILKPGDRVELINGEIYEMSPVSSRHGSIVKKLGKLLNSLFGDSVLIGVQDPIGIDQHNEPEPDISILKFREDFYSSAHPGPADVLMVIEVAGSSLKLDRETKKPLYASCGIPEYWIVELDAKAIEVYTYPDGKDYSSHQRLRPGDSISLLGRDIEVKELLAPIL